MNLIPMIMCLVLYVLSFAYILVMDTLVLTPNQLVWIELSIEDRIWIMCPMLGIQLTGLIIYISSILDDVNRCTAGSLYVGTKFPNL